jgi:hypothetical protein
MHFIAFFVKKPNPTYRRLKSPAYRVLTCVILFVFVSYQVVAQTLINDVKMAFVKDTDIIKKNEVHFNALKVWNNSAKPVSGEVVFSGPENWNVISFSSYKTTINPGDTVWIPVRVSPSFDAIGGISYLLNATFRTKNKLYSVNSYLTIPLVSNWDISTLSSLVYLTESMPVATFHVKLTNKGNVNEVIKLDCNLGKLLTFRDVRAELNNIEYIKISII